MNKRFPGLLCRVGESGFLPPRRDGDSELLPPRSDVLLPPLLPPLPRRDGDSEFLPPPAPRRDGDSAVLKLIRARVRGNESDAPSPTTGFS